MSSFANAPAVRARIFVTASATLSLDVVRDRAEPRLARVLRLLALRDVEVGADDPLDLALGVGAGLLDGGDMPDLEARR